MKTIIEYVAGTKGDMLCRFLNNEPPNKDKYGKTLPINFGVQNWMKELNPYNLTLYRFEETLSKNTKEYITAHPLWVTHQDEYISLLEKYEYEILSIKFEPKHYATITIESIIKNDLQPARNKLSMIPDFAYKMRGRTNDLFNEMTEHRTLLSYEELFCSDLPYPLNPDRKEEWLSLVENSWCVYYGHGYKEWKLPQTNTSGNNDYIKNVERYLEQWMK